MWRSRLWREEMKSLCLGSHSYVLWLWALYGQGFLPFPRTHPNTASSLNDKQGYTDRHTLAPGLRYPPLVVVEVASTVAYYPVLQVICGREPLELRERNE